MQARVIILLVFALIVAVFAVLNTQPVTVDYLFGKSEIQLIFVIIFSILLGAFSMLIISSMKQIQLSRQIKTLDKENSGLKEELEQLTKVSIQEKQPAKENVEKAELHQTENKTEGTTEKVNGENKNSRE